MADSYRMERIERLLRELEYEIQRGMLEQEIDESLGFNFIVPASRQLQGGVVVCQFRTRPVHAQSAIGHGLGAERPTLKVINGGRNDKP